jgi:NADH dehydrogenase
MTAKKICLLGGTGFVGRRIAERLYAAGHRVWIPTRSYARHRDMLVLPTVQLVEGDIHDPAFLRRVFKGMDAVINLTGILNQKKGYGRSFQSVHADLPAKIAEGCHQAGVPRLLHMSALGAAANAPSRYLQTKAQGEAAVHQAASADFHVTSFRPSVIFGPHDSFTNRFANLLRRIPCVFPLACPEARFQPVFVDDVARAIVDSLDRYKTFGQRYNLCGPQVYTLREIVEVLVRELGLRRRVIGLNDRFSAVQAAVLQCAPGTPFSLDNYRSLKLDSVCSDRFPAVFNLVPTPLERVLPTYLHS